MPLPAKKQELADLLERLLVAQGPRMSAWALRPEEWPMPYKTYEDAIGLEQVGFHPLQGAAVVRMVPKTVDPVKMVGTPANGK